MNNVPRLVIAGTQSGVGKTTVTLALLAALTARGRRIQAFKAGPDFIDPGHHTAITGRPSRNLDGWMLGRDLNLEIFHRAARDADLSVIEGMMGLFDGSDATGEVGSTAELAKQLAAPVLLVIDGSAMARSAAAMASGYARFDPDLRVAGVLFNKVAGDGHYRLLKAAVEAGTNLPVVGYLQSDQAAAMPDRHLGLVTALEYGSEDFFSRLGQAATRTVDLDRVEAIARSCEALDPPASFATDSHGSAFDRVRVGVAYDPAFCFYYPENLELLEREGAELIKFSPLRDDALPDVDLLYFGGGYPELHGRELENNRTMREAVHRFSTDGGVIYAECGGMMYLTQAIRDLDERRHEMVGLFSAEAVMRKTGLTLGYRTFTIAEPCVLGPVGLTIKGHEFHYSHLVPTGSIWYAGGLRSAQGRQTGEDGLIARRTVALYSHLHFASQPQVARSLVAAARERKGSLQPGRGT